MQIIIENTVIAVKNKMTDIHRKCGNRKIYNNYYNNCDNDKDLYTVYGQNTVLLWHDDNNVTRGYFYSSDEEELVEMMAVFPKGCVIDYITRNKYELAELMEKAGFFLWAEMHHMSNAGLTEKERKRIYNCGEKFSENVRCANLADAEELYDRLYKVFDPQESHLPSLEQLKELINNQWVAVYKENGKITAFHLFKVKKSQYYGYQTWNSAGPQGYFAVIQKAYSLYMDYLKAHNYPTEKGVIEYCWVNVKNTKSMAVVQKYLKRTFDGLYDYVYVKKDNS